MQEPENDPDTDPIVVTHSQDPSLEEDEMIIHTFVDPNSIKTFPEDPTGPSILNPYHPKHLKENE